MGQTNSALSNLKNKKDSDKPKMDEEVPTIQDKYEDDAQDMINIVLGLLQDKNTVNLELGFTCENLVNLDLFSLSDPIVVVFIRSDAGEALIGRTEIIRDNLNPKFTKQLMVPYNANTKQILIFRVFDVDDES